MARITNAENARLTWRVQNVSPRSAVIDLFDTIGDPWMGTDAKSFIEELRSLDVDEITLNINSPGGYVDDALGIYDAVLNHPASITAHVVTASSAASFVMMAADRREIAKNGKVFIHDAQGIGIGDSTTMRRLADILDEESDNIASIYAERAGGTQKEWRKRMQADGYGSTYRGQEAVDIGLVDAVAEAPARNAAPMRIAAQEPEQNDDLAALLAGQDLVSHIGYKPPLPSLEGLLVKQKRSSTGG